MLKSTFTIAIIGGGFSGTLTAVHLLRHSRQTPLRVVLINPTPTFGRGLAYRFEDDNLVLNVPAGNMSAFADDPTHFVNYCQAIDPAITARSFVSRRLYGEYLQYILAQATESHPDVLELKVDEAVAVVRNDTTNEFQVVLASGMNMTVNHVVLALGHQPSKFPLDLGATEQQHVIQPWDFSAMHNMAPDAPVVILGSGHTAVDALFSLAAIHRGRRVWLVSRHGLLPQAHRLNPQAPTPHEFPEFLRDVPGSVRHYTRALRRQIAQQQCRGHDWRDVLNDLRPHTPQLWQSLTSAEQRRFLRCLLPYWDIHRHRLAPIAAHRLQTLLQSGQAKVIAAHILSIQAHGNGIQVHLRQRGLDTIETIHATAIINCTGPNNCVNTLSHPLFKQLLTAGLLKADANGLGLMVSANYQVMGSHDQPVQGLWYMGPMLKSKYWEAIAVPELRLHAQRLANTLIAATIRPTL